MKYTFEKGEHSTIKLTINVDAKEWAEAQDEAFRKSANKFNVPGFRKAHVPKAIVLQH